MRIACAVIVLLCIACGGAEVQSAIEPAPAATAPKPSRLDITMIGSGTGRVESGSMLQCTGTCAALIDPGVQLHLVATADPGSVFVGFGGGCSGLGPCTLAPTADTRVWANFALTAAPSCPALPDAPAMREWVRASTVGWCLTAAADGRGTIAFLTEQSYYGGSWTQHLAFLDPAGTLLGEEPVNHGRESAKLFAQASGFAAPEHTYLVSGWWAHSWDSSGKRLGDDPWLGDDGSSAAGPDPRGGVLVAGRLSQTIGGTRSNSVVLVSTTGAPVIAWGPRPLASSGKVLGAGVDLLGRSLVLTDAGAGRIAGQWFDQGGNDLTGEFTVATGRAVAMGALKTSPLIGGGLLVVQETWSSTDAYSEERVAVVNGGEASTLAVPAWLSNPATRVQLASGGRAYALLPLRASNVPCTQRVEIVAPDGTACGSRDYPIAQGTCTTKDLQLGVDGTVLQQLPDAMETQAETVIGTARTCTLRWWPAALK